MLGNLKGTIMYAFTVVCINLSRCVMCHGKMNVYILQSAFVVTGHTVSSASVSATHSYFYRLFVFQRGDSKLFSEKVELGGQRGFSRSLDKFCFRAYLYHCTN